MDVCQGSGAGFYTKKKAAFIREFAFPALFDLFAKQTDAPLLQHAYADAELNGKRGFDESGTLRKMADRSPAHNVIVIAGRDYENYNLMVHIQEKANFSVAVQVCRQFLLGNVSPPDVEAVIRRHLSPIRTGRSRPRNMTAEKAVSFLYRVA